jgi:hypothetical protein
MFSFFKFGPEDRRIGAALDLFRMTFLIENKA